MNNIETQQILRKYEDRIFSETRHIPLCQKWKDDFPKEGGVYVIWEDKKPVYVGETSGIKSRMGDLSRPINHPFTKRSLKDIH